MDSRWPNGAKAAISFTMDNLGEAQDVNKGVWPADQPIGNHFSVRENLPRMLDMLDKHGIKATYFAESWSLDVYPQVIKELQTRGHEVAWHGFQHEVWSSLSQADEELNFKKSWARASEAGIQYKGFRPPGGSINDRTYGLFQQYGIKYVSPLDKGASKVRGVTVLPFDWREVDAFYYMEKFASIRKNYGEPEAPLPPTAFRDHLLSEMKSLVEAGGYMSILFHPFLQTSEQKFAVLEEVLEYLSKHKEIWCAPCEQVEEWLANHPESMKTDLRLMQ